MGRAYFLSPLEEMDTLSVGTQVLALDLCFPAFTQEQASTLIELAKVTSQILNTKTWVFFADESFTDVYGLPDNYDSSSY